MVTRVEEQRRNIEQAASSESDVKREAWIAHAEIMGVGGPNDGIQSFWQLKPLACIIGNKHNCPT